MLPRTNLIAIVNRTPSPQISKINGIHIHASPVWKTVNGTSVHLPNLGTFPIQPMEAPMIRINPIQTAHQSSLVASSFQRFGAGISETGLFQPSFTLQNVSRDGSGIRVK
jgi:hypothetical protein